MTVPNQTLATGAGTALPVTFQSSGAVQSTPASEWSSFATRYQQYRVRAIRVRGKATNPVQSATVSHGVMFRGDFIGGSTPATAAQVLSDENSQETATCKDWEQIVTWKRNPNARLWNPTNAVIPSANTFAAVQASATTPALTTATTYYALVVEWEVEFRGSQ
jgi:hypothetical protein